MARQRTSDQVPHSYFRSYQGSPEQTGPDSALAGHSVRHVGNDSVSQIDTVAERYHGVIPPHPD